MLIGLVISIFSRQDENVNVNQHFIFMHLGDFCQNVSSLEFQSKTLDTRPLQVELQEHILAQEKKSAID